MAILFHVDVWFIRLEMGYMRYNTKQFVFFFTLDKFYVQF